MAYQVSEGAILMAEQLSIGSKLAHNVGLIVLASQELEKNLKIVAVASGQSSKDPIMKLIQKLERRSLGNVVEQFLKNVTPDQGGMQEFKIYFSRILDKRNKVVHHFFETYGEDLNAGRHKEVLAGLAEIYLELQDLAHSFRDINEAWIKGLLQEQPIES